MAKANLGELLIKIGIDTKKLDAGLSNANKSLKKFGLSSNKVAIGVSAAFAGMALAVGAFGRAVNDVGSQFEQSMATVGAVAGSTEGQLGLMETRAREVGRSTLFTARQSADAMVEFARAGFKAGEIIAATEPAINLAGATASNMTSAVKGVSAALKVFQLDASQAARVADVFAVATQNSLFDLQGLIDAMKYGGPASAAFDLTIEQATAYMMVLRNMGLEASQAGVYLRQILTSAANLTPKASKIFESVGISAEELNPRINHLDDIIKKLGDNAQLTAEDIQDAFGKRGGPVVAALVNQYRRLGEEGLNFLEFQKQLEQSAGKAEEMYQRQIDTVIGQFTIARSAMEDLFIEMFFGFNGQLKNLGTAFEGLFNEIRIAVSSSGYIGFADPIQRFANIINSEKGRIAEAFVSISNAISILLNGLSKLVAIFDGVLLPVLVKTELILKSISAFVLISLVSKSIPALLALLPMISASMSGVAAAFASGTVAAGGFSAAITAIGGPITVAIGLFAALAVAVLSLTKSYEGISDQDLLLAQQDQIQKRLEGQKKSTTALIKEIRTQASESGKLSGNLDIYLDQLNALDEKQIQVGLSSGTLFETSSGAVMSLALAFEMQKKGMEDAESFIEDAKSNAADLRKEAELENEAFVKKHNLLVQINKDLKSGAITQEVAFSAASEVLNKEVTSMDQITRSIGEQKVKISQLSGAFATLEQGILRGELLANQEALNASLEKRKRITEEQLKAEKALKKAIEDRINFEIKLLQQIESLKSGGDADRRIAINNAYQQAAAVYKAEMQAMKDANADEASIAAKEEKFNETLKNIELKSRLETINELKSLQKGYSQALFDMQTEDALARLNEENRLELEAIKKRFDAEEKASGESDALDKQRAETRDALAELYLEKKKKILDEEFRAEFDRATKANNVLISLQDQRLKESERLEKEKDKALLDASSATLATRIAIEEEYNNRIIQARRAERLSFIEFLFDKISAARLYFRALREEGEREASKLPAFLLGLFGRDKDSDKYIARQQKKFINGVNRAQKRAEQAAKRSEKPFFQALKKISDSTSAIMKGFVGAAGGALLSIGKIANGVMASVNVVARTTMGIINQFSGFSFSPTSMARELAAAKEDAMKEGASFSYAAEARKYVDGLVNQALAFTQALADGLGPALEQLVERLPEIMEGIIAAIPKIADALAANLPDLIMVVIDNLPALFTALVDGLVDVALALFDALPEMLTQLLSVALPQIITSLLSAIPKLIKGFVEALPGILTAIIESIPVIIEAILASLPDITVAIIQAIPVIVIEIIKAIPRIAVALVVGIFKGLKSMMGQFGQIIAEAFASVFAFFENFIGGLKDTLKGDPEKTAGQKALTTLVDILTFGGAQRFEKAGGQWAGNKGTSANPDGGSAYSGISYVPANMRVNVHKGEAIIPANRNAQMNRGGMDRAAPASYGGNMNGSGGQPIDIAIMAEGRLLDAVQITAMRRGHAPEIKNELRRASGVTVGFNRGSFDYWTK